MTLETEIDSPTYHAREHERCRGDIQRLVEASTLREDARRIQALEYERRLSDLNNSHARLEKDRDLYLAKTTFEEWRRESDRDRELVRNFISSQTGRDKGVGIAWGVAVAGISMAVAIGSIIVSLLSR